MQNFKKIKNFENFKRYGERILSETLRELLSADKILSTILFLDYRLLME